MLMEAMPRVGANVIKEIIETMVFSNRSRATALVWVVSIAFG
jgi:hypothetical protein